MIKSTKAKPRIGSNYIFHRLQGGQQVRRKSRRNQRKARPSDIEVVDKSAKGMAESMWELHLEYHMWWI